MPTTGDAQILSSSRRRPLIARLWSHLRRADRIRRDIRYLERFSDHELRDLGIERGTIINALRNGRPADRFGREDDDTGETSRQPSGAARSNGKPGPQPDLNPGSGKPANHGIHSRKLTMTNTIIDTNKATVAKFLAGTHSPDIEDVAVIDETVVPHIVCHGFPGFPNGEFSDRESYKMFFRVFRQSFSDMTFETLKTIATEEFVSAHWEIWATHSGEFQGIDPDGARVVFDGVALYRMEDGKIAETWLSINEPLLVLQLGKGRARAA